MFSVAAGRDHSTRAVNWWRSVNAKPHTTQFGWCTILSNHATEQWTDRTGSFAIAGHCRWPLGGQAVGGGLKESSALEWVAIGFKEGGIEFLKKLYGSFAFVLLDNSSRRLVAVCDHFRLSPLYWGLDQCGTLSISDSVDGVLHNQKINEEFVAGFIVGGSDGTRTIWQGVNQVPGATVVRYQDGKLATERYWRPERLEAVATIDAPEAASEYRRLLDEAVLSSLAVGATTWCDLSGGLDSSSVVSVAAELSNNGRTDRRLGGTITFVDTLRDGDDQQLSEGIARQYDLKNLQVVDCWPWKRDGELPPLSDQPARDYPFFARNRAVRRVIEKCGGTRLLTGVGPDHALATVSLHIPDLLWQGRVARGLRELFSWASLTRQPFLAALFGDALLPLGPKSLVRYREMRRAEVPHWLSKDFAARLSLGQRVAEMRVPVGQRGQMHTAATLKALSRLSSTIGIWSNLRWPDVGHPFLDVPLIEFSIRLPYHLRTNPRWTKPTLRNAMTGTLPGRVLHRRTKGDIVASISRAFYRERSLFVKLLSHPVLGDFGFIEPQRLMTAVDAFATRGLGSSRMLLSVLALETWLSRKSGRCDGEYVYIT